MCQCVCVCVHELYSQHIAHSAVAAQRRRVGGAAGKKSIMGKNLAKSKGRAPLEPQSWLTERPTERATERPSERRSHVCLSARRIRQQQLENVAWNLSKNSHNKCNTHTHTHTSTRACKTNENETLPASASATPQTGTQTYSYRSSSIAKPTSALRHSLSPSQTPECGR